MIVAVDSHHAGGVTRTAAILFRFIVDGEAMQESCHEGPTTAAYVPGELYRRELPGILAALERLNHTPSLVIVDGYVSLADGTPGLGAHLYHALDEEVSVIGVAKSPFKGADYARQMYRGGSRRPLYITAAGMSLAHAEVCVRSMHGAHRLPTMLKRADMLSRTGLPSG